MYLWYVLSRFTEIKRQRMWCTCLHLLLPWLPSASWGQPGSGQRVNWRKGEIPPVHHPSTNTAVVSHCQIYCPETRHAKTWGSLGKLTVFFLFYHKGFTVIAYISKRYSTMVKLWFKKEQKSCPAAKTLNFHLVSRTYLEQKEQLLSSHIQDGHCYITETDNSTWKISGSQSTVSNYKKKIQTCPCSEILKIKTHVHISSGVKG